MATHSSVLAWRIPGTGEPGGLLSMGSHRVRHDSSDLRGSSSIILESNLGSNHSNFIKCAPFNPAIPFLGFCPNDILTYSLQDALKNGKLLKHQ